MTRNSYLCRLIAEHPDTWRRELEALSVNVKEDPPLAIFNYGLLADFTNPVVREARGIIIRLDTLDVVAWPFTKFCNIHEPGAAVDLENFDWRNSRCQEKIDGSIIKLFFNPIKKKWQFATNSTIDAADATAAMGGTFADLIQEADNFGKIPFETLNPDETYIFELVSPFTQVVVHYEYTHLFHIGTRNNITGEERTADIGIEKPEEYPFRTLESCMCAAEHLNDGAAHVRHEGFVVVDPAWHRVKIKSPEYFAMHRLSSNNTFKKERVLKMLCEDKMPVEDLVKNFPNYSVIFRYYSYRVEELLWNITRYIYYVRNLYRELGYNRAALAAVISKHRYASFGFSSLDNTKTAEELLSKFSFSFFCRMIPDYTPEKIP